MSVTHKMRKIPAFQVHPVRRRGASVRSSHSPRLPLSTTVAIATVARSAIATKSELKKYAGQIRQQLNKNESLERKPAQRGGTSVQSG